MIGYLSGKFIAADETGAIIDVGGVGYSVLISSRIASGLTPGASLELYIHTNLRENALELFGFQSLWEKKVFQALVSVSGVGPKTALAIIGGLEPETVLSAIVREDRATLTSISGVGKKTAELIIVQIGEKARKLLAERPRGTSLAGGAVTPTSISNSAVPVPPQGASVASEPISDSVEVADIWSEALAALVNLGYRDADALAAIRAATAKQAKPGQTMSLEQLILSSLQLMSRGI